MEKRKARGADGKGCGNESRDVWEVTFIGWPSSVDWELNYVHVGVNILTWNRPSG